MKNRQHINNTIFRLFASWFGLVLYVAAFSPVGMVTAAVLGTLDTDHSAFLQTGATRIRLVLHHEAVCVSHEHHAVARALNIFAQPSSDSDPDHVIQFAGGDGFWRDTQIAVVAGDLVEQPLAVAAFSAVSPTLWDVRSLPPTGPPPRDFGNLLNIRSTVLLI